MAGSTIGLLVKIFATACAELSHAFSTAPVVEAFTSEELTLLDRVATAVVQRGMAAPAVVFFESLGPMNFLGSQAVYFLMPIMEWSFHAKEVERVAHLLERRETFSRLIALIESKSFAPLTPGASTS